ncbi:beta-microseminoprotein-like [Rana temporaria]|uniref:beta-microseminoprotein-like n=1 Tax=Rana temporaria TaxID=8407 RepID=UPI001AAD5EDE|nr:beta-microseminoprotein-like [Rana temporaria]
MRILVTVCIVLAVSVALSSAVCTQGKLNLNFKTRTKGCMHKGTFHKIDTKWTVKCEECECSESGLYCCTSAPMPSGYDKEACNMMLDKESCTYKVTRKDDPSIPCEYKSMKG